MGVVETRQEKLRRRFSLWIIYFTTFLQSIGLSIFLTGVWPYLQQLEKEPRKELLGWIIAAHPIGQLVFSPLIGYLCTFLGSIRLPSIFCLLVFLLSSLWYAFLPLHETNAQYFMVVSRVLAGVSAGIIAPCRTFVCQETLVRERTPALATLSLFQGVGWMVGPAIQIVLTELGPDGVSLGGRVRLSMYTSPAWVCTLLGLVNLLLFHSKILSESHISAKEYGLEASRAGDGSVATVEPNAGKDFRFPDVKPDYVAITVTVVSFFSVFFNFSLLEAVAVPMLMDQFGLSDADVLRNLGIAMTLSSALSILLFYLVGLLSRRFDERSLLVVGGFLPTFLGRLCFFPYPGPVAPMKKSGCFLSAQNHSAGGYSEDQIYCAAEGRPWTILENGCPPQQEWCFRLPALRLPLVLIGFLLVTLGFPFCFTILQSLYSKILGPRPQGTWNGALLAIVSLSKIVGAVLLVYIYQNYGTGATSGVAAATLLLACVLCIGFHRRLVPFQIPASNNSLKLSNNDGRN